MEGKKSGFGIIIGAVILITGLYGCASTGSPSGGPKDTKPPKLDSLFSTPNKQTNFKPRKLEFTFDEFIEVKDALKQVLVSPPLTYIPQVKHRGKKVTFTFDEKEILRENATYTINFGEAIVDFHEGNKIDNFTFVFSTGDVLDSLSLKGSIKNSLTQEPEVEMVVFLYDKVTDSIVAKEKPFYFAKPNKEGIFEFKNIKSDTFKLIAIKDENLNYLYDLETEKIAFSDSLIYPDINFSKKFTLYGSVPIPSLKTLNSNTKSYGKVNILFNTNPTGIRYTLSDSTIRTFPDLINDSINIHYATNVDSFFIYLLDDTLKIKPRGRSEFNKKNKLKRISSNNSPQMLPKDSIMIGFNQPLDTIRFSLFKLSDSIGLLDDAKYLVSENGKNIIIKYDWLPGEKYSLSVDSALVKSIYGLTNDSFGLTFNILTPNQMAALDAIITDLDSTQTYVIKLMRDKTPIYRFTISNVSKTSIKLKGLVPDRYNLEIIQDTNGNGKWDPADYWQKKQAEQIKLIKGDKIRANWESEFTASWKTGTIFGIEPKEEPSGLNPNKEKTKSKF
ncbi:MAG: Ig-like domain-containing protein [Saprospiraceae bacterium]|nr:Ig-like domain-containing protein [Saprospiraceae bacterium]